MKNLKDYIIERGPVSNKNSEDYKKVKSLDYVYAIKDKDLDDAIFDVCDTEADAEETLDRHLKENPDSHMKIEKIKRSEVENI